jgi:hypothetical protein
MAKSLEQLRAEKDRQMSELNAELATTRHKHTHTELFFAIPSFCFFRKSCGVGFAPLLFHKSTSVNVLAVPGTVQSVLQICDILVRILIRGSVPSTNGSGSCYFCHSPSRRQQKTNFFCLLLFEGIFTSFVTDIKSYRSHRTKGFSYYFCLMIAGRICTSDERIRIQKAQKHTDTTDPAPQHCVHCTTSDIIGLRRI